ncbi:MAG: ParB/RepB/Spo0J family partition protein [Opitutaceae bacterium]|jgi:ParB/RepB/Spo0J family partition protein
MTQKIPISKIVRNPANPRTHFVETELRELGESLKSGQLQNLIVMTYENGYMLIDGERRWRAAKLVGISALECVVNEMTKTQTLLTMLTLGRSGNVSALTPIEEANGYAELLDLGATQQEIANRTGVSQPHVAQRLKLLSCASDVQKAIDDGLLPVRTALLLVGLPHGHESINVVLHSDLYGGSPMPYAACRDYIAKEFAVPLKSAPFDLTDETLAPGACTHCQERGANNEAYRNNSRMAMHCFAPECFQKKISASRAAVLAEEEAKGHEVISPEDTVAIFDTSGVSPASGYVPLSRKPEPYEVKPEVLTVPTWRELVGENAIKVFVAFDKKGTLVELAKREDVMAVLEDKSIFREPEKKSRKAKADGEPSQRDKEKSEKAAMRAERLAQAKSDKECQSWLSEVFGALKAPQGEFSLWSLMAEFAMAELTEELAAYLLPALPDAVAVTGETGLATLKSYYRGASPVQVLCVAVGCTVAARLRAGGINQAWIKEWHGSLVLKEAPAPSETEEQLISMRGKVSALAESCALGSRGLERFVKFEAAKKFTECTAEDLSKILAALKRIQKKQEEPKQKQDEEAA